MTDSGALVQRLRYFLAQDRIVVRMQDASNRGRPAVEGIGQELLDTFGEEVSPNWVKQRIGKMVKEVMQQHAFAHDSYGHKTPDCPLFTSGSLYYSAGHI